MGPGDALGRQARQGNAHSLHGYAFPQAEGGVHFVGHEDGLVEPGVAVLGVRRFFNDEGEALTLLLIHAALPFGLFQVGGQLPDARVVFFSGFRPFPAAVGRGEDEPCGLGFPDGCGVILVMGVRPFLLLVVQGTAGKAHEKA